MTHRILSKRDQSAVVRYAMDRIDEALAQAWMREFCAANNISVRAIRDADNRPVTSEQRIKVAVYLCDRGVMRRVVARVMNRHFDMVRYYIKPAHRKRRQDKRRKNTERWRGNVQLSETHL